MALDNCSFWNPKNQNNFFSATDDMVLCWEPSPEWTFNIEEIFPVEESRPSLCVTTECPPSAGLDLQTCRNNVISKPKATPNNRDSVGSPLACEGIDNREMNSCTTEPDFVDFDIPFEEVAIEGFQSEEEAETLPFSAQTHLPWHVHDETESNRLTVQSYLKTWAEALEWEAWDLLKVIVDRLRQTASPMGSREERMAFYLLHSFTAHENPETASYRSVMSRICRQSKLRAFQALYELYPYARVAHFTANQSILEAVKANHARKLHIVDFDVTEGLQWPPLMEALADGFLDLLRITAIKWDDHDASDRYRFEMSAGETGWRLADCAASFGIPFLYEEIRLQDLRQHMHETEDEDEDRAVVFNVMVELPHMMKQRNKVWILEILSVARGVKPLLLTFASAGVQSECRNYGGHMRETVEYYSSLLESVEAGLPEQAVARSVMEQSFVAPKIQTSVSASQWNDGELICGRASELPRKCGFSSEGVEISEENARQAWELVGFSRGSHYALQREACGNEFCLRWRNMPLVSVSTWR